jgi:putative PIN family toxin of toxin-antitoxin system
MQRIVLDTNVFVSALIQRSYPYLILDECLANSDIRICVSHAVYQEYSSVLQRPKFARFPDFFSNAQLILSELERIAIFYNPRARVDLLKDLDDNRFLELAKSSKAHFLITGNHRDFDITEFQGTQIVNPRDYFQNHMLR